MDSKTCKQCGESKDILSFRKKRNKCKKCEYDDYLVWKDKNRDKANEYAKKSYQRNKEKINSKKRNDYKNNPDKYKDTNKRYISNNRDKVRETLKNYYNKNIEDLLKYHKEYREKNKDKRAKQKKEYEKKRRKNAEFKLRKAVSNAVYCAILRDGGIKGGSILNNMPYSINELKIHIESQFEPWMNWENWGVYDPETWDDNDDSTWMWQIDHIVPQYNFPYSSMEDNNFKKCWALSNLRPYSAKNNVKETRRIK
jgi:hypothetical protein